ncbi:MAG: chloride channel protein [Xanthomonadales bacterium]|nr:chloride channel protein [Xanthomonadales bacterium]
MMPSTHESLPDNWLTPSLWRRRAALWIGAVAVGLVAIAFASLADLAYRQFRGVYEQSSWWSLLLTPACFALLVWLTEGFLRNARGSGIPQVIAATARGDTGFVERILSLRVSAAKLALTVLALGGGASVGREGPTVHVGAGLLYAFGRRLGFVDAREATRFALAGGAAGIAAAFNTPLAGVVFAIEELSNSYEHRFSGVLLGAVLIGGVVSLGIVGDYAYFGRLQTTLPLGQSWLAVLLCGLAGGLMGGLFARLVLLGMRRWPGRVGEWRHRHPVQFAALCGLLLAALGIASGGSVFGTGYHEARSLLQDQAVVGTGFGAVKFIANLLSYVAGIPGGIFSPALAVGAGLGSNVAQILPSVDPSTVVLLGMCAYLAGVTQAPLTSAVISLELTSNQTMLLPILAACLIARAVSSLLSPLPLYRSLANRLLDAAGADDTRRKSTDSQPASTTGALDQIAEPGTATAASVILPVDPDEDDHLSRTPDDLGDAAASPDIHDDATPESQERGDG